MRKWKAGLALLAGLGAAASLFLALAANPATNVSRWPGPLDELRQHPWLWVGLLGGLTVVVAVALAWMQSAPPAVNDPSPPQPTAVPAWFVDRHQTREAVDEVCRGAGEVGITTSLSGAGGFGKTTLAIAVANHRRVQRRFRSRIYTVTIGRDVRGRSAVSAKVAQATKFITGDTTEFDDPHTAGAHLGRLLDARPRTLLVLDDVWEEEQLAPFLHGGRHCVRLVTTRNPKLLPPTARTIPVDQMSHTQAKAVLTHDLPPLRNDLVDNLLQVTGRWALLLRLTNRSIALQTETGADPAAAAGHILDQLRNHGPKAAVNPTADPTAWDLDDLDQRNEAVQASIEAATSLLPLGGAARFTELGIFAEDESIPVSVVVQLWHAADGLTEHQARALLAQLHRLSLISLDNTCEGGRISLHDVVRDYLRSELGTADLIRLNGLLTDAIAATLSPAQPLATTSPNPQHAWWQLQDGYLLDHLIDHLLAAERISTAEAVAGDVRWVEARLHQRGPTAPWADLARINSPHARLLAHSLIQSGHLLTPTNPPHALISVLHNRLDGHPHWHSQITARRHDPDLRPCLTNLWPLPDIFPPALQRTLTGDTGGIASVAVAPEGTWLATGSDDGTVRIWDWASGTRIASLTGHVSEVHSVVIAPDSSWFATTSYDGEVRVWDRASGACTATLDRSGPVTSVAIAPDSTWLATTSRGTGLRMWDQASGTDITVIGHAGMGPSVAIARDGAWFAITLMEGGVQLWDRASDACTATLTGHTSPVTSVAIAPDGTWLVTTDGRSVRIWDRASGTCTATLTGHAGPVTLVAIAPDSAWLVTTSYSREALIWDRASGTCTATLTGHTRRVESVAIAPDGTWLVTTDGRSVRIWDRASGTCTATLTGHTRRVESVAIAPDGTCLITTDGQSVRIWDREFASGTAAIPETVSVTSVAIAPDGAWLATAGDGRSVRIWDRASATCVRTLWSHIGPVLSVAIAADGAWLATT
ncbi:NB-ARC domain-containing protein, partial [Streptomyces nigrescens]